MAEVKMTFDTIDKTCVVTINGQVIQDARMLTIYKYSDHAELELIRDSGMSDDGMQEITRVYATEDMKKKKKKKHRTVYSISDLVTDTDKATKIQAGIRDMLRQN